MPTTFLTTILKTLNQINSDLGGNQLIYNESEDAYYIQHAGADTGLKKLGEPDYSQMKVLDTQGDSSTHKKTVIFAGSYTMYEEGLLVVHLYSYNQIVNYLVTKNGIPVETTLTTPRSQTITFSVERGDKVICNMETSFGELTYWQYAWLTVGLLC